MSQDNKLEDAAQLHVIKFGPKGYSYLTPDTDYIDHINLFKAGAQYMAERARKQGWSDVLKLVVSARPNPLKNCPELGCAEYRDWLETELHKIDAAMKELK